MRIDICGLCSHEHYTDLSCSISGCLCKGANGRIDLPSPILDKLNMKNGIDPFAPEHDPWQDLKERENKLKCPLCNYKHGSQARYACMKCNTYKCSSQVFFVYKEYAKSIHDNDVIAHVACQKCKGKVELIET